ncbi:hypothetical protein ACHRV1_16880 [Flavobacterium aquidurense]|uniref:Lipoprotein n=1 Tax=Flavobacterium piscisymbiosum TaxID=2893753 RepID=A0ABS8MHP6_9FLAO|nr:hypothetical protein [Flavobacterium sp. F-30]MCC9065010.1 hypothetical protein [Flavobacterium sp. F-30]
MKKIIRFLILFLIATVLYSCKGVPMVQTTREMKELKVNESKFVNKPLKYLLKEIGPQIKTGIGQNEDQFFFSFRFTTLEQQKLNQGSLDDRVSLYVYVKERIDWQWEKRPKGIESVWTKEDAKKYGNLIVVRIKIIEKNNIQ